MENINNKINKVRFFTYKNYIDSPHQYFRNSYQFIYRIGSFSKVESLYKYKDYIDLDYEINSGHIKSILHVLDARLGVDEIYKEYDGNISTNPMNLSYEKPLSRFGRRIDFGLLEFQEGIFNNENIL